MAVERAPTGTSLVDILDRVLDKGIVIDAYVRATLVGIGLIGVEASVVVASVATYPEYTEQVSMHGTAARPQVGQSETRKELERVRAENVRLRSELEGRRAIAGG